MMIMTISTTSTVMQPVVAPIMTESWIGDGSVGTPACIRVHNNLYYDSMYYYADHLHRNLQCIQAYKHTCMTLQVVDKSLGFDKDSECTLYTLMTYKVCNNVTPQQDSSLTNSVACTANVTLRAATSIVVNTSSILT